MPELDFAQAYLGGSDLAGLGYCSGIADDSSSLDTSYFVMVTEAFFNYYSPLCGRSVKISFKTTIQATIIDASSSPPIQATSRADRHRSTTIVLSVLLPVVVLIVTFLGFVVYKRLRARRNRPVTTYISNSQREQTSRVSPYYVDDHAGYDASPVDKAARWNDKAVDRGGYLEPVPAQFLQPAPARPPRPQSLDLDQEGPPAERRFSLASLSRPDSVEPVGPSSSSF
ncbi:hypothetical protein AURDEDRAFT_175594 [Auricularia subglabra TFB-10046 SS5]|nr:hypothetical protein AURDEDRAFT_175594 [Auricularia subglabra TFB-10046 SS5]